MIWLLDTIALYLGYGVVAGFVVVVVLPYIVTWLYDRP